VPQNEAGAPENRMAVLRTCPDAPSRNLYPVLGPVVTARPGTLPFLSGSDTAHRKGPRRVPAIGPALHNLFGIDSPSRRRISTSNRTPRLIRKADSL
jgi:hypothetical protein